MRPWTIEGTASSRRAVPYFAVLDARGLPRPRPQTCILFSLGEWLPNPRFPRDLSSDQREGKLRCIFACISNRPRRFRQSEVII